MIHHGFVRVARRGAGARCRLRVQRRPHRRADRTSVPAPTSACLCSRNSLTGYTCGDLFHHPPPPPGVLAGLQTVVKATSRLPGLVVVGVPLRVDDQLFNRAAVIFNGKILGLVPKSYLPNHGVLRRPLVQPREQRPLQTGDDRRRVSCSVLTCSSTASDTRQA